MKDQKTLAYLNLFGILGALGKLAELDADARALLTGIKPVSLGIAVSGGPYATLHLRTAAAPRQRALTAAISNSLFPRPRSSTE